MGPSKPASGLRPCGAPRPRPPHRAAYIRAVALLLVPGAMVLLIHVLVWWPYPSASPSAPCRLCPHLRLLGSGPTSLPDLLSSVMARLLRSASAGLAVLAHAVFLLPARTQAASAAEYTLWSVEAIQALNTQWYNVRTGIWDNAWWNSANALTTLADFTLLRLDEANALDIGGYMVNTYVQAQKTTVQAVKTIDEAGMVQSSYCLDEDEGCIVKRDFLHRRGYADFLDEYYDDEGWWALALIRTYDSTGGQNYLDSAIEIFDNMQTGQGTPCGGGIYWSKQRSYVNAIANELFLAVAASLANRVPQNGSYLEMAKAQWQWFNNSGMINSENLINDGLTSECKNNGEQTWTYNQGVILGGLVELARATGDASPLDSAMAIADAAITHLSSPSGVLEEAGDCGTQPGHCGMDGQQFKGIFIRNLMYLYQAVPLSSYRDYIITNANSIWANDRSGEATLGVAWTGPYYAATGPTQSSALDCLVAAVAVSS